MVEKADVFRCADAILDEGVQPTLRLVRERLVNGGSFSDIAPYVVAWAAVRGIRLRPTRKDLPAHLHDRLATAAAEIWCDGLRSGGIAAHNEQDRLTAERDAASQALAEMAARVDVLEGLLVESEARNRESGENLSFWERLLHEVEQLLGDRSLDARTIVAELPESTKSEATARDGAWGPVRLAYKMRAKIKREQLFLEPERGVFRRR